MNEKERYEKFGIEVTEEDFDNEKAIKNIQDNWDTLKEGETTDNLKGEK